ncbi:D-arabitol dehydrogenase [Vibrio nigripulchritudo SO65]|uniref:SDR family NAD(P)-dependent oxidoreductase n=1 Tax=Vibrio nigripulchritudo TaxID=28173 RepID=UPI0003B229DD|nr:SDR family oxidoreductase [Vibrio nigripulchritudo]CCN34545.1 D-arabitol dehydrogenase [Vibrio nigripulchritudo AM115]CCN42167.1 D-arabitol dehydrogenase [Vibrio nigripulchritudo FTn2]CCN62712.1 D-arabitol dehydrogenase [Vibrio nigripulchritudo POn4]CCN75546.1 D-arabitol dehydrogenase [Vibrio nigripulchritudo SO65]
MMSYRDKLSIENSKALVTGAGRGIGAACAEALAEMGAKVFCTDFSFEAAKRTTTHIRELGYKAEAFELDVTNTVAIEALAEKLPTLDILVCNAGIANNYAAEEMADDAWNNLINVNLNGVFRVCRAFGKGMLAQGKGSIINIGSMSGFVVNTPQPQCHYNASKAAVHQLTKSLAVEWADRGVRVNAIASTYINTPLLNDVDIDPALKQTWIDMTPMKRMGNPDEIASVVQFLASPAASLMTGSIVNVDGGYTCL